MSVFYALISHYGNFLSNFCPVVLADTVNVKWFHSESTFSSMIKSNIEYKKWRKINYGDFVSDL